MKVRNELIVSDMHYKIGDLLELSRAEIVELMKQHPGYFVEVDMPVTDEEAKRVIRK